MRLYGRLSHFDYGNTVVYQYKLKRISKVFSSINTNWLIMNIIESKSPSQILKITASNPISKQCDYFRITLKQIQIGGKVCFLAEKLKGKQAFHQNIMEDELVGWLQNNIEFVYKQVCVVLSDTDVTYLYSANGNCKRLSKQTQSKHVQIGSVNRAKNYLINEGDDIPALVDLGVFTKEGKIVRPMFDKFKQINRFVEILDDQFKNFPGDKITILDFGCGKSYLTFIVYYYFSVIKNVDVKIVGYDLKADVVKNCNALAQKYGYKNLQFVVADVSKDKLADEHIDCVISLHACDTATDYALHYAISRNVKYIFSVPCCQHEVNLSIKNGGELDCLLKYGIIKERTSSLLTDAIRGMILEDCGYSVDMLEFVDFAHSPKNIMIRACRCRQQSNKNRKHIQSLMEKYQFSQKLFQLVFEK